MKESEERSSNIDEQKARIRQRYKGIDPEEGYAVFDIQEKKKATDKSIEKAKEPSTAESEEKSYEQQTLFPSTNMY